MNLIKEYFLKHYKYFVIATIAAIISSSSMMVLGKAVGYVIDHGIDSKDIAQLQKSIFLFILVSLILSISTFVRYFSVTLGGEKVINDIRKRVYIHLMSLSMDFFVETSSAGILSTILHDITILQSTISNSLSMMFRSVILAIGGLVMIALSNGKLSAATSLIVVFVISLLLSLRKQIKKMSQVNQSKVSDMSIKMDESISGITELKAFCMEQKEIINFEEKLSAVLHSSKMRIQNRSFIMTLIYISISIGVAAVLYFGGYEVIKGRISPGDLSSFAFYIVMTATSLNMIGYVVGDIYNASGAMQNLINFLETKPTIINTKNPVDFSGFESEISIENVVFGYKKNDKILQNINLKIKKGETIAIVGVSGVGKSSIVNLLMRFYDVDSGSIRMDGADIRDITLHDLRNQFGLVSQTSNIFSGSIIENILYGNNDASEGDINEAIKMASMSRMIKRLPEGLNTRVGNKGLALSGGQRQRIAIARAMIKKPKILLFDEATSSLDTKSEREIQSTIDNLIGEQTTIIISHRLHSIKNVDKIIVLDNKKITAIGTHNELLNSCEIYKGLYILQN